MRIEATNRPSSAPNTRRTTKRTTGESSRRLVEGAASVVLNRLLQPCVQEAEVAHRSGGARLQSLDLVGKAVHPVGVRPVDVAALVVLDLLHLVPDNFRLRVVSPA